MLKWALAVQCLLSFQRTGSNPARGAGNLSWCVAVCESGFWSALIRGKTRKLDTVLSPFSPVSRGAGMYGYGPQLAIYAI